MRPEKHSIVKKSTEMYKTSVTRESNRRHHHVHPPTRRKHSSYPYLTHNDVFFSSDKTASASQETSAERADRAAERADCDKEFLSSESDSLESLDLLLRHCKPRVQIHNSISTTTTTYNADKLPDSGGKIPLRRCSRSHPNLEEVGGGGEVLTTMNKANRGMYCYEASLMKLLKKRITGRSGCKCGKHASRVEEEEESSDDSSSFGSKKYYVCQSTSPVKSHESSQKQFSNSNSRSLRNRSPISNQRTPPMSMIRGSPRSMYKNSQECDQTDSVRMNHSNPQECVENDDSRFMNTNQLENVQQGTQRFTTTNPIQPMQPYAKNSVEPSLSRFNDTYTPQFQCAPHMIPNKGPQLLHIPPSQTFKMGKTQSLQTCIPLTSVSSLGVPTLSTKDRLARVMSSSSSRLSTNQVYSMNRRTTIVSQYRNSSTSPLAQSIVDNQYADAIRPFPKCVGIDQAPPDPTQTPCDAALCPPCNLCLDGCNSLKRSPDEEAAFVAREASRCDCKQKLLRQRLMVVFHICPKCRLPRNICHCLEDMVMIYKAKAHDLMKDIHVQLSMNATGNGGTGSDCCDCNSSDPLAILLDEVINTCPKCGHPRKDCLCLEELIRDVRDFMHAQLGDYVNDAVAGKCKCIRAATAPVDDGSGQCNCCAPAGSGLTCSCGAGGYNPMTGQGSGNGNGNGNGNYNVSWSMNTTEQKDDLPTKILKCIENTVPQQTEAQEFLEVTSPTSQQKRQKTIMRIEDTPKKVQITDNKNNQLVMCPTCKMPEQVCECCSEMSNKPESFKESKRQEYRALVKLNMATKGNEDLKSPPLQKHSSDYRERSSKRTTSTRRKRVDDAVKKLPAYYVTKCSKYYQAFAASKDSIENKISKHCLDSSPHSTNQKKNTKYSFTDLISASSGYDIAMHPSDKYELSNDRQNEDNLLKNSYNAFRKLKIRLKKKKPTGAADMDNECKFTQCENGNCDDKMTVKKRRDKISNHKECKQ